MLKSPILHSERRVPPPPPPFRRRLEAGAPAGLAAPRAGL